MDPKFLNDIEVGHKFSTTPIWKYGRVMYYVSTVLDMEPISTRFGKPDRILTVQIEADDGYVVDSSTKRWASQLQQGLV